MNKLLVPSAAALLILVVALSSFTPALAVTRVVVAPFLQVVTIPEDDQVRQTGVMILGLDGHPETDFLAQFKIIVTLNGVLVDADLVKIDCNVIEKDKEAVSNPKTTSKTVITYKQFDRENLRTKLLDVADQFRCKPKWKPNGDSVGVLDVYFTGPAVKEYIADHILVVEATYTLGRQVFKGAEIQDICLLGFAMGTTPIKVTKSNGDFHYIFPNPMGDYQSCEELALYQRYIIGGFP